MLQSKKHESGNVFMFILLGVVLFGALAFTIARGFRSDTTSSISARQAELLASDILNYAQRMSRTVDRARRDGCSESEINFENQVITSYINTNAPADEKCNIFSSEGGTLNFWDTSTQNIHQGNTTAFFQQQFITGDVMHHPDAGTANVDLSIWIADIDEKVCSAMNQKLGISGIPDITGENDRLGGNHFVGSFGTTTFTDREILDPGGELENQMSGCLLIETDASVSIYAFYSILLAR